MPTPTISVEELNDTLGAHVRQDYAGIFTQLLLTNYDFLNYVQLVDGVTDEIVLTQFFVNSLLQPGNKNTFDPKAMGDFVPRTGKVRPGKVDISFTPQEITNLWKSYLGYKAKMAGEERTEAAQIPFANFFMGEILRSVKRDIRQKALYKGVHDPAGTTPEATVNGFVKIFTDLIGEADPKKGIPAAQVLTGPAITDSNAVDEVEKLTDLIPSEWEGLDLVHLADPRVRRSYNRDYRNTYGTVAYNQGFDKQVIEGTNIRFIDEVGLAGTGMQIITPVNNLLWLTNSYGGAEQINVEREKRNLHFYMDMEFAPEVAVPQYMVVRKLA